MTKRSVGRPSEYKPEYCQRVINLASEGMSKTEIATNLGHVRQTLDDWMEQYPEFSDAMAQAKEICRSVWEMHGRKAIFGKDKDFNHQGWYINMRNRFRDDWYESSKSETKNEHTGPDGGALEVRIKMV